MCPIQTTIVCNLLGIEIGIGRCKGLLFTPSGSEKKIKEYVKKNRKKRSAVYSLIFFSRVDFIRSRLAFE